MLRFSLLVKNIKNDFYSVEICLKYVNVQLATSTHIFFQIFGYGHSFGVMFLRYHSFYEGGYEQYLLRPDWHRLFQDINNGIRSYKILKKLF